MCGFLVTRARCKRLFHNNSSLLKLCVAVNSMRNNHMSYFCLIFLSCVIYWASFLNRRLSRRDTHAQTIFTIILFTLTQNSRKIEVRNVRRTAWDWRTGTNGWFQGRWLHLSAKLWAGNQYKVLVRLPIGNESRCWLYLLPGTRNKCWPACQQGTRSRCNLGCRQGTCSRGQMGCPLETRSKCWLQPLWPFILKSS